MRPHSELSLLPLVVLALLAAAPAVAEQGLPPGAVPGTATDCAPSGGGELAAPLFAPVFLAKGGRGGGSEGPTAEATCIADCWNGGTVTCYGSSCSATDSSCPSQRGYCWGSSTGTRYCPACQGGGCGATAQCNPSGSVSCSGTSGCFAVHGCYASCDGGYTMCPNPDPDCPF